MVDKISVTARAKLPLQIGFNYMWAFDKYGLFFGIHRANPDLPADKPSRERASDPVDKEEMSIERWVGVFQERMNFLRDRLKVSVVRIFLFCNAINWGKLVTQNEPEGGKSVRLQAPPYLHPRFPFHLKHILECCAAADLKVIPVLLDFGIGEPKKSTVQRLPILSDNTFYDQVFDPLLDESKPFKDTIFAWEVMNEPVWLTTRFFPFRANWRVPETLLPTGPLVSDAVLIKFLAEGVRRIEAAGFPSTVGHRFFRDLKRFPTGNKPQFHFYPTLINDDPFELPDAKTTGLAVPPFIGEFGARPDQGDGWMECRGRDLGRTQNRVFERLLAAERKRYQLTMLWPDGPDPFDTTVDPVKLSSDAELGIRDYLKLHGAE
jgi:hypothetical protein